MNNKQDSTELEGRTLFEDALNETGFGAYNYLHTALTGCIIISYGFISFSNSIIIPASACELNTTVAQQGALASTPVIGIITGAFLWGFLGDTRGRRNMLIIALICSSTVNAVASLSVNWIMLLVLQFIASLLAAGEFSLSMTLLSESVPMAYRNLMMLLVSSLFLLAQGLMAALAIPIIPLTFSHHLEGIGIFWNSWRTLMLVYSIPSLLSALWLISIRESPKFMLSKGKEEDTIEILRAIHRRNKGKSAGDYQVKGIKPETTNKPVEGRSGLNSFKDQIVPLFKKPLLKNTVIMASLFIFMQVGAFFVWLPTIANQLVVMIQGGESTDVNICEILNAAADAPIDPDADPCALNSTALLIVLGVGCVQSLVNGVISMVVDKTGRRNMVIAVSAVTGVSGIIINLVPNAIGGAVLLLMLLLGLLVMGLYTAITVSLFPTHLRTMAVSLTMTAGRVASFASIQILNFLLTSNCEVGFYVFSAIFASSALIALFLPNF